MIPTRSVPNTPFSTSPRFFQAGPSCVRGESSRVDRRTDVYALGVVLYQALTQELPFDADSFFRLQELIRDHTPTLPSELRPELGPELDGVIMKCLAKKARDRYDTALRRRFDLGFPGLRLRDGVERFEARFA